MVPEHTAGLAETLCLCTRGLPWASQYDSLVGVVSHFRKAFSNR